jgi:hypothetical protein
MHTNEIFIENGRFHGRQIANAVALQLSQSSQVKDPVRIV